MWNSRASARTKGFGFHASGGIVALGCADLLEGRHDDAIARLRQGLEGYMAATCRLRDSRRPWRAGRGPAPARAGSPRRLLISARRSRPPSERASGRAEPELRRIEGDILLASSREAAPGERCFLAALATAKRQGAVWWELRAAVSLARLWASEGDRQRAVDLLSPVYASFTEGFDTPDLQDARALLDALQ